MDVAERRLEEAWPDCAVGLNHARHPGRVALVRREAIPAEQGREVLAQPAPQLLRRFGDVTRREFGGPLAFESVDLGFEQRKVIRPERDLTDTLVIPAAGPVECVARSRPPPES